MKEYPFYIKSTVILFGLILLTFILFTLHDILVPLAFAAILAILLNPLVSWFERMRIPKSVAIVLSMLIAIIFFGGILFFLSSQIMRFGDSIPILKEKFRGIIIELQVWLKNDFGISSEKQMKYLNQAMENSKPIVGRTLGTVFGVFGVVFLIPVYLFLFLFYKSLILNFLFQVWAEKNSNRVREILNQTKNAIQSYMVGLLIEAGIVATLNSVALLIIGVQYAVLLGVIGALLNLLPYIGGLIAIALPLLVATVTETGYTTQFLILGAYLLIQFVDNNYLVPKIVSSKVQINALISIVVVLLGGALWGFAGMFLSIPFVAVLKIIFDRVPEMKPWGALLGDEVPASSLAYKFRTSKKKSVAEKL